MTFVRDRHCHAGCLRRCQQAKEILSSLGGGHVLRHMYMIAYILQDFKDVCISKFALSEPQRVID